MGQIQTQVYSLFSKVSDLVPHVDYEGQRLGENLFHYIILLFAAVGFAWGYACQQFSQTVYILGAGFMLACLLVLPPWPFYRRHTLRWINLKDSSSKSSVKQGSKPAPPSLSSSKGDGKKKK